MKAFRWLVAAIALAAAVPAGASHEDRTKFEQPILFRWAAEPTFEVLIVPPHHGQLRNRNGLLNNRDPRELHPFENSYLDAVEDSVLDLTRAINTYGSPALKAGLRIQHYVLGRDELPPGNDFEVIITSDENKTAVLGVAWFPGSSQCLITNSMMFTQSFTWEDMFNVNAQEFGHCLGLDHVLGAAVDGPNGDLHDPLNGGYPHLPGGVADVHCYSNLNVAGLEEVFRPLFGTGTGVRTVVMDAANYRRISNCASPD